MFFVCNTVCKIFRLERKALQPSFSAQDRLKVYEQMGDLCSRSCVGFFNAAVHYYLKQVHRIKYLYSSAPAGPCYKCMYV